MTAKFYCYWWCSVAQSCLTLCDLLDCSTPGFPVLHYLWVCSNSGPLSWWCCPTISFSVAPFSSCPQSFPASGIKNQRSQHPSFPVSWLFISGGQSIGVSASASVLPMNIQGWFLLGLTGLISLLFKRFSRVFSNTAVHSHQFYGAQPLSLSSSHIHTWQVEKPSLWLYGHLSAK